jgi:hypothetical protein
MRLCFLLAFLFSFSNYQGQIRFKFSIDSKPLVVGEKYFIQSDTSWIQIDDLKFFVVYYPFFSDENTSGSSVIHLVDLIDSTSWNIPFTEGGMKESNNFEFAIGLDSATTMSTQFSGALDPAFGMYWAWNTGYIHFKLEGKSNLVPSSKNEFQYHIGGYSGKFETQRWISAPIKLKNLKPIVQLELADFIREILNLKEKPLLMIPGKDAVFIADGYNKMFVQ